MKGALGRILGTILLALAIPVVGLGATYTLPDDAGSGPFVDCSIETNGDVVCTDDIDIDNGDVVELSRNVNLSIDGELSIGNNTDINPSNSFSLNIAIEDDIDIGNDTVVYANLNTTGDFDIGDRVFFTGNIDADDIDIGNDVEIIGNLSAEDDIEVGDRFQITGNLNANDEVKIGNETEIVGNVNAGGDLEVGDRANINGDISGDDIDVGNEAVLSGNINADDDVDIGDRAEINGNISAGDDIDIGNDSIVGGDIVAAGDIDLGDRANVFGNMSADDDINVGNNSNITGQCSADGGNYPAYCNGSAQQSTCSAFHGQATINEIYRSGNDRYLEVKILNTNIDASEYNQWELRACRDTAACSNFLPLSTAEASSYPWLVFSGSHLPGNGENNVVQLDSDGMDVLLRDSSGQTIDYVRNTSSANYQNPGNCLPAYDWQIQPSNTHLVARVPDGTGDWKVSGPGGSFNEFPPSEGETNDDVDTPDDLPPVSIDISNTNVVKGNEAEFSVSLSSTRSYPITVDYATADGPDTEASNDYEATSGTLTFNPGELSKVVRVQTFDNESAPLNSFFYLTLSNPDSAFIQNHFATATFAEEAPDDFEYLDISFPSKALTCQAVEVTVRACSDGNCSDSTNQYGGNVTLTASPVEGWSGGNVFQFNGEASRIFSKTDEGTVDFEAISLSPAPSGDPQVRCNGSVDPSDCQIEFFDEGFLLVDEQGDLLSRHHIAGRAITDLTLKAVRRADDDDPDWEPPLQDNGDTNTCVAMDAPIDREVEWSAITQNPSEPFGYDSSDPEGHTRLMISHDTIDDTIPTQPESDLAFTTIEFEFNSDGESETPFTLRYDDVGQIELRAQTSFEVEVDGETETRQVSLINSGPFTFRPDSFAFSDITCGGNDIGSGHPGTDDLGVFCRAGEDFSSVIRALNTGGAVTPNFGNESNSFDLVVSSQLEKPDGGNDPDLTGVISISNQTFENGEIPTSNPLELQWPEVGVMTVHATMPSYLGWTDNDNSVSGASDNIGRFIPYDIRYELDMSPGLTPAQGNFTYQGQVFNLVEVGEVAAEIRVIAENISGERTKNYVEEFFKSPTSVLSSVVKNTDDMSTQAALSLESGSLELHARDIDFDEDKAYSGEIVWLQDDPPNDLPTWKFNRVGANELNADENQQSKSLAWTITATALEDEEVCRPGYCTDGTGLEHDMAGGNLVYGRIRLFPTQGAASRPTEMPVEAQYWDGERFDIFELETGSIQTPLFETSGGFIDFFSLQATSGDIHESDLDTFQWSDFVNGKGEITLARSNLDEGPGESGRILVVGDGGEFPEHLLFDWQGTGDDTAPSATASFGTYEGRPPVLFILPQGR